MELPTLAYPYSNDASTWATDIFRPETRRHYYVQLALHCSPSLSPSSKIRRLSRFCVLLISHCSSTPAIQTTRLIISVAVTEKRSTSGPASRPLATYIRAVPEVTLLLQQWTPGPQGPYSSATNPCVRDWQGFSQLGGPIVLCQLTFGGSGCQFWT